jgi:hypothetical protein
MMASLLPKSLTYSSLAFEFRKRFIGFDVPSQPHFDDRSLKFFRDKLQESKFYLEFGSGGSTVLAAHLGKRGFSVDSDRFFLRDVRKKIKGTTHQLDMVYADIGSTGAWGKPKNKKPTTKRLAAWRNYAEVPFKAIGSEFYDLILVDGRFRVACALKTLYEGAVRKATFTLLFDDYKSRKHYHAIEKFASVTKLVGRMAVIEIDAGKMLKVPSEADIARFARDMR